MRNAGETDATDPGGSAPRESFATRIGLPFAVVAAVAIASQLRMLLDDSFIAYRYAANLAGGHGLVFNVGERVEGYTNFLWVLVLGGVTKLGVDVIAASQWLGIAAAAGAVVFTHRLAVELGRDTVGIRPVVAIGAAMFVAIYPGITLWGGSGLETTCFTMLVTWATVLYLRSPTSIGCGLVLALAAMTRPEALLWGAAFAVDGLVRQRRELVAWRWLVVAALTYSPYYAWRFVHFGYPLPNTFYAKTGGGWANVVLGLQYTGKFLLLGGGAALVVLGAIALWRTRRHRWLFAALIVLVFMTVTVTGGDFMTNHRFFVPLVPTLTALAAVGLGRTWHEKSRPVAVATSLVAVGGIVLAGLDYRSALWMRKESTLLCNLQRLLGAHLDQRAKPGEPFASVGVGVLAYYTNRHVIDLVGLTDEHIAHQQVRMAATVHGHKKFDAGYVVDKNPAFVLLPADVPGFPFLPAMAGLIGNEDFEKNYVYEGFGTFRRRDIAPKE